jgi:hypothetical protein
MSHADTSAEVLPDLRALVATILPGDGTFPSAADLPVAERVAELLRADATDAAVMGEVLAPIAAGKEPAEVLRGLERTDRRALQRVLQLAYVAYYGDPAVRSLLDERHGYPDRPPQPLGYAPDPGTAQLARLEARRIHTLATDEWWSPTFAGVADPERPDAMFDASSEGARR